MRAVLSAVLKICVALGPVLLAACAEPSAPPASPQLPGPPVVAAGGPAGPGGPAPLHLSPTFDLVGPAADHPHNVLIVSLDTVRADHLSVYGGPAQTPTLSAFAQDGARFDQALSNFPETCLSHQTMLSGVLPQVHGNVPAAGGSIYAGPNVAEIAGRSGFATAAFIGGITLTDRSCGFGRGFGYFDDQFPVDPQDMKRPAEQVTAAATAWIAQQDGPWLAFVHYFDAHFPYTPAPPWDTRYDPDYSAPRDGSIDGSDASLRPFRDGGQQPTARQLQHVKALYDGELSELDAKLAPLLAAVGPDTVVVVTSDHGESFEHGYYFNHRAGLWDSVLHVPLLIQAPGIARDTVIADPVGLVDLAPTLLELAGLPQDRRMQGRSLAGALRAADPTAEAPQTALHFAITDPWMPDPQWSARTPTHKLIERAGASLLYDLVADPDEVAALASASLPAASLPAGLHGAHAAYDALVAQLASFQVEAPQPRPLGTDEVQRLEALGYVAPAGSPPGSPNPQGPPLRGPSQGPAGGPPPPRPAPGGPGG